MKNLLKLIPVFLLSILIIPTVNAQVDESVQVGAQVNATITLSSTDVSLGTIQTGQNSILSGNRVTVGGESNIGDDASHGTLTIIGSDDAEVIVSWNTDVKLDKSDSSDPLDFTPSVYDGGNEVGNGTTTYQVKSTVSPGTELTIGGTLAAPGSTGAYSTSLGTGKAITFTVQYN